MSGHPISVDRDPILDAVLCRPLAELIELARRHRRGSPVKGALDCTRHSIDAMTDGTGVEVERVRRRLSHGIAGLSLWRKLSLHARAVMGNEGIVGCALDPIHTNGPAGPMQMNPAQSGMVDQVRHPRAPHSLQSHTKGHSGALTHNAINRPRIVAQGSAASLHVTDGKVHCGAPPDFRGSSWRASQRRGPAKQGQTEQNAPAARATNAGSEATARHANAAPGEIGKPEG